MAGAIPLIFKKPSEFPGIMKFEERVEFKEAHKPVRMYMKNEVLVEEEVAEIVKDKEYHRKKKKQMRFGYKSKSILVVEESPRVPDGSAAAFQFEGSLTNSTLLGPESLKPTTNADGSRGSDGFKYVLLKKYTVAPSAGSAGGTVINITPVGDWYTFKKPSLRQDDLEENIEREVKEREEERKRRQNEKFTRINGAINERARNDRLELGDGDVDDANFSLFGKASSGKGRRQVKHLTEDGVDQDALQQANETAHGDYERNHADDDEENVDMEQNELNVREDEEITNKYDDDDEDVKDSDEEDEDDDDDEEETAEKVEAVSGFLNDETVGDAERASRMFGQQNVGKRAHDQVSGAGGGAGGGAGSGEDGSSQLHPDKRVKFSEDVVGDGGSSGGGGGRGGGGGGSAGGGGTAHVAVEAELTEAVVREFFTARGGRVIVSDVKDQFKSLVKKMNKQNEGSGKRRFTDIVNRLTITEEDPALGKVLRLKDLL